MYVLWVIMPITFMLLALFYVYHMISHTLEYFGRKVTGRKQKLILFLVSLLIVGPAFSFYHIWTIVILHFVVISIVLDLIHRVLTKINKGKLPKAVQIIYYTRVLAVCIVATILLYGYYNMAHVICTSYIVYTQKPLREDGYRIALIADLHLGNSMGVQKLQEQAQQIAEKKPDIVILCGDIVDESTTKEQMQGTFAILSKISNQYGVYFVYGNHDVASYSSHPNFTATELENTILESGIQILKDTDVTINDDLVLVGRADCGFGNREARIAASDLIKGIDQTKEVILLDHQPCEYDEVQNAGYDLIVSGHTHAGQIWPAGFFARLFRFDDFNYGYKKENQFNAIVTSGMAGWGYPIRTEKHSEYVIIDLKKEP